MHKRDLNAHANNLPIAPIGLIHTPFKQAAGTPIQGVAGQNADGVVELHTEYVAGLRDLTEFERVWFIYSLDRASGVQMVVHPYMDTTARGVFATRSPARPNHIGISVVRLLGIEKNRVRSTEHRLGMVMIERDEIIGAEARCAFSSCRAARGRVPPA